MIRVATEADVSRLLEMGQRFADKARLIEHVGYEPESMERTFRHMIRDTNCFIAIGEAGAVGGMKAPHPFNHSHWIAQELFWWSEGREGIALLKALEEWSARYCQSLRMITLEAVSPERTGMLYQRRGYRLIEHGYLKGF